MQLRTVFVSVLDTHVNGVEVIILNAGNDIIILICFVQQWTAIT